MKINRRHRRVSKYKKMPQTKDEKDKNFYIKRIKNDLRVHGNMNIGKDIPYR